MKSLYRIGIAVITLMMTAIGTSAQDNPVILQLAVPLFVEDFLQPVVDEYEAANPGIVIQMVPYQAFGMPVSNSDDPEEYQDNLVEYFTSADILVIDPGLTSEATRAGYLLDLVPVIRSDPSFMAEDFHNSLLQSFEWDGGLWGLPISTSFVYVSYIPEAFDAMGLAYPTDRWTLADLDFAARTLTQYNADGSIAMPGLAVLGNQNRATLFASLAGQPVYSQSTFPNDPDLTNPQLETLLDQWLLMIEDGLFQIPDGIDNDDIPITIGTGGFGGRPGGGGNFNNQDDPERATALLPGGRAGLDINGYGISSGTQYPEEAYNFMRFLIEHPTAVTASLGNIPALKSVETGNGGNQGGGPGGDGPGGALANAASVPDELVPLVDIALERGMPLAEIRYADSIVDALNLMQSEGYDARTALDEAQAEALNRVLVADNRAMTTTISVAEPKPLVQLVEGEIALNFAVLAGGRGSFAQLEQWQTAADEFAATDPAVGIVRVEAENPFGFNEITQTYDCFYSSTNEVPDADLSLLLNFDPLFSVDPAFDPNDFVAGILEQVSVNNQTWALPVQISPLVMRFDYDIYNAAGVNPPQGAWTVSEFEDAIRNLEFVMTEDEAPVVLNASGQSALLALITAYGGLPFDTRTDPVTVNFTDPNTVNAIQQVLDLAYAGYISYAAGGGPGGGFGGGNQTPDSVALYSNVLNAFVGGGQNQAQNTDGFVPFPRGNQYNAVPFDLGTAYISANTQQAEACYRFIIHISQSDDLFQSMPTRYSMIYSPDLAASRGEQQVSFFDAMASLMNDPNTIMVPTNINVGTFGMTNWLLDVFDAYLADAVVDLAAELAQAEQITRDYLICVDALPPFDPGQGNPQEFRQQILDCQASVDTGF